MVYCCFVLSKLTGSSFVALIVCLAGGNSLTPNQCLFFLADIQTYCPMFQACLGKCRISSQKKYFSICFFEKTSTLYLPAHFA